MQADMGWIPVWEDSTCRGATKPHVSQVLSPALYNYRSRHVTEPMLCDKERPPQWEARALRLESSPYSPHLEMAGAQQWRPSAAKQK